MVGYATEKGAKPKGRNRVGRCRLSLPVSLLIWYKNPVGRDTMAKTIRHREQQQYWSKYYEANRERLLKEKREWWAKWYPQHKQELLPIIRQKKWTLKQEVLTHYGNGKCACVKCGFDDLRALSIDHILGEGNTLRKRIGSLGGISFYRMLRKEGYPQGYQTLCMNCQFIKRIENREHFAGKPEPRGIAEHRGRGGS